MPDVQVELAKQLLDSARKHGVEQCLLADPDRSLAISQQFHVGLLDDPELRMSDVFLALVHILANLLQPLQSEASKMHYIVSLGIMAADLAKHAAKPDRRRGKKKHTIN